MAKLIDLTGRQFGRLNVLGFSYVKHTGLRTSRYFWLCRCKCGVEKDVDGRCLRGGETVSCGCHKREANTTHGMTNHPLYSVWCGIKRRCCNPNDAHFKDYGARGITMCSRWMNSFADFYADMGDRPTSKHTIERIKNHKGYEPGNCKWATRAEQNENTRRTKLISFRGTTLSIAKWAKRIGVHARTLHSRIDRLGWTVERALTTSKLPSRSGCPDRVKRRS